MKNFCQNIRGENLLIIIFLVLIFSFPRSLQPVKIGLLLILLITLIPKLKRLQTSYFAIVGLYASLFIIPLIVAIIYHNQTFYILDALRVNLFFPALLFIILQQFSLDNLSIIIKKSAFISIIIICILALITLLNGLGYFPVNLNALFYPEEDRMGFHDGYIHLINSSLNYITFIIPLLFVNKSLLSFKSRKFYVFLISFIIIVISGRRGLLFPYIFIFFLNIKKMMIPLFLVIVCLFTFVDKQYLAMDTIVERVESAIKSTGDSYARKEQSEVFVERIAKRPIFGYGLGGFMKDYKRNEVFENAYERIYHYQAYTMGIPLLILTFLYYLYLMLRVQKNEFIRDLPFKQGLLLGTITMILVSYTNPYWMSSFDFCLPLALLMRFSQSYEV